MLIVLIYYLLIYETCAGSSNKRKSEETESNIPTKIIRQTLEDEPGQDITTSFVSLLDQDIDKFVSFVQDTNLNEIKETVEEELEGEQQIPTLEENLIISESLSDVVTPPEFSEVEKLLDITLDELAVSLDENILGETNYEPTQMEDLIPQENKIVEEQTVILPLTFTGNLDEQLVILPLAFSGSPDEQVIILQGTFAEDIQEQVITLKETFRGNINDKVLRLTSIPIENINEQETIVPAEKSVPRHEDAFILSEEPLIEQEYVDENTLEAIESFDPNTLSSLHSIHETFDKQAVNEILHLSEEPFLGQLTELEYFDKEIVNKMLKSKEEPFKSDLFTNKMEIDQPLEATNFERSSLFTGYDVEPSPTNLNPKHTEIEEENSFNPDVTSNSYTLDMNISSILERLSSEPIVFNEQSLDISTLTELTDVPMPSPTPYTSGEPFIETDYSAKAETLAKAKTTPMIPNVMPPSINKSPIEKSQLKELHTSEENIYFIKSIEPEPSTSSNIISPDIEEIYLKIIKKIKHVFVKSFHKWYKKRLDDIKKMIKNIKISKDSTFPIFETFKNTFDPSLLNLLDIMGLRGQNLVKYELFEYESFDSISISNFNNLKLYDKIRDFKKEHKNQTFSILCEVFVQLFNYFPIFPELMTLGSLINLEKNDLLLIYLRLIHLIIIENKERIEEIRSVILFLIKKSFLIPFKGSKNINIRLTVEFKPEVKKSSKILCVKNHSNLSFLMWEFVSSKHRVIKYHGKKKDKISVELSEDKIEHFRAACFALLFQQVMFTEYHNIPYDKYKELLDSLINNSECVFCLFEKYLDLLKTDLLILKAKKINN